MFIKVTDRPHGVRLSDKFLLLYSEVAYLAKRMVMRMVNGKEKRDEWFREHNYTWLSPISGKIIFVKNQRGFEFWIKVGTTGHLYMVSASFEPNIFNAFKPREGDVVVDVGASIGVYTVYAGRLVGKKGKVIALEPMNEVFQLLARNIKQNALEDSVIALRTAASDKEGKSRIYFLEPYGELNSLVHKVSDKYIEVNTVTIDYLVRNLKLDKVDWMKIDVEGAEYNVLLGAIETLNKNPLNLIIEVFRVNEEKVFDLLKSLGYSISILESYDYDYYSGQGYSNVLATKTQFDSSS